MTSVLYFPDGNRRFAKKGNLLLSEVYNAGLEKTLRLFSDFFIVEKRADLLVYVIYTYLREDSSFDLICNATERMFQNLINDNFFTKRGIRFKVGDNFNRAPEKLKKLADELSDSTKDLKDGEILVLFSYSLEKDFDKALLHNPKNYGDLRKGLLFHDIDLVIRTSEMSFSEGPVYALGKAQMIQIDKYNPELGKEDLEKVWNEYCKIKDYRKSISSTY